MSLYTQQVSQEGLAIDITANINQLRNSLNQARALLKKTSKAMAHDLNAIKFNFAPDKSRIRSSMNAVREEMRKLEFTPGGKKRKGVGETVGYQKLQNQLKQQQIAMSKVTATEQSQINQVRSKYIPAIETQTQKEMSLNKQLHSKQKALNGVKTSVQQTGNEMKKMQRPFAGWAMSIMFFGMQLRRTFDMVWKTSSKVFNEVMHSVEGTVTGFDHLSGSMAYLGFVVGQALEPIAYWLAPIVDKIADWALENEGLVRTFAILFGVVGSLLMYFGMSKLALDGMVMAGKTFGATIKILTTSGGLLGTVFAGGLTLVLAKLALIGLAVAVLVAAWRTDFGGIRDFMSETFGIFAAYFKSVMGNVIEIFKGFFILLEGLFTGDFNKVLQGATKIITNFIAGAVKGFIALGAALWNVFIFISNIVSDVFHNSLLLALGAIRALIAAANKIPGIRISTRWIDQASAAVTKLKESGRGTYATADSVANAMGFVDGAQQGVENWVNKNIGAGTTVVNNTYIDGVEITDRQVTEPIKDLFALNILDASRRRS